MIAEGVEKALFHAMSERTLIGATEGKLYKQKQKN